MANRLGIPGMYLEIRLPETNMAIYYLLTRMMYLEIPFKRIALEILNLLIQMTYLAI